MKVRYLSEAALDTLKKSLNDYLPLFAEETNAPLVARLKADLQIETVFRETPYVFPDAPLNPSKASEDELASISSVFLAMKELPNAVAMDERLWAGIAIDLCWDYVRRRWDIAELFEKNDKSAVTKVGEHFFFMHNARRSFTRNAISRLWWLGRLTYDEGLADPFARTRVVAQDLGYIVDLLERNFSNNRRISTEFVDAVEKARDEVRPAGGVILRPELRTLCKYLNMLGGVYILDSLPEGMIYKKIHDKAVAIARKKGDPEPDESKDSEADDDEEV